MEKIAIIGLGYVGLPLAVAMARSFQVTGFDINAQRIEELQSSHDRTGEILPEVLKKTSLKLTGNREDLAHHQIYIITVPTPVNSHNQPDLKAVMSASQTVGSVLSPGAIVVYESTVYPGVTEDICGPLLEKASGLTCGTDFFLGYSPERINPGDRLHTVDKITKVVSGQTPGVTQKLKTIYGSLNQGNIFCAASIKTAEAAKVIENAQRDINIAFINEITMIFNKVGISVYDVLEASATKWNFLPFTPGLVGGHCIGVDPFYLAHCAKKIGHNSEVILAGRRINDAMGSFIAAAIHEKLHARLPYSQPAKILVLGLTFKENVPDLRNTKVIDIIRYLKGCGHSVHVHDPHGDAGEAQESYNIDLQETQHLFDKGPPGPLPQAPYDCIIGAVPHDLYTHLTCLDFEGLMEKGGLIADIKHMWKGITWPQSLEYWTL
jgi:UDP-N-acetyl-D-galactosamine dehydrogenase